MIIKRLNAACAGVAACILGVYVGAYAHEFARDHALIATPAQAANSIAVFDDMPALKRTPAGERFSPPSFVQTLPQGSARALIEKGYWPILKTTWNESDERGYGDFIRSLGESGCRNVSDCLKGAGNPYRSTDKPGRRFYADCADLPYVLRAYYASKNGLPFAYAQAMRPVKGFSRDFRYSFYGNEAMLRRDVLTPAGGEPVHVDQLFMQMINDISSAMYRTDAAQEGGIPADHYPVALNMKSIVPGTVIYDPAGHLAIVYKVEKDGRIHFIDSHPDNSLTRGVYGARFARTAPMRGGGFKKWRPLRLVGAMQRADGSYEGGRIVSAGNNELHDFSLEQYYGNGVRPQKWQEGTFTLGGQKLDYYEYVRAAMAGGNLAYDPLAETAKLVASLCSDLQYRVDAVDEAIGAGMHRRVQPSRLPQNIYGTYGDWETYSSPSRDARLRVSFKELHDNVESFIRLWEAKSPRILYKGKNLRADLLKTYDRAALSCQITYTRSNGQPQSLGFDEIVGRLFRLSFDPHHCVELRWGASTPAELSSCPDNTLKRNWYAAEQRLRNQLERTYEARMDADLDGLRSAIAGTGSDTRPEIDVRRLLTTQMSNSGPAS